MLATGKSPGEVARALLRSHSPRIEGGEDDLRDCEEKGIRSDAMFLILAACNFEGVNTPEVVDVFSSAIQVAMGSAYCEDALCALASPAMSDVALTVCLTTAHHSKTFRGRRIQRPRSRFNQGRNHAAESVTRIFNAARNPPGWGQGVRRKQSRWQTGESMVWQRMSAMSLIRGLRPYEWVLKQRACVRLDKPGAGARFVRQHAPVIEAECV